jgi:capsular polysaccharide biosynthesis protein
VATKHSLRWADSHWDAEPVEVPRYAASLRRSLGLIAAIVLSMSATVFFVSTALPERYEATARMVLDDRAVGTDAADVQAVGRRLATVRALVTTRDVRTRAATRLQSETADSLENKVSASVDPDANIVDVHAADDTAAGAAAIANAVAQAFIARERVAERQRAARTRQVLLRDLRAAASTLEAQAIQARLSDLNVRAAGAGGELALAEPAQPPTEPSAPRPVRNTIFALCASLFLGVLAALGLAQLAPRVSGARELGSLAGFPVLGGLSAGRLGRSRDGEAYDELQTALSMQLPASSRIVVVAGALPGDRKAAQLAAGLAESFAVHGSGTLLVSADLRRPRAHELLDLDRTPGLVELLEAVPPGTSPSGSDVARITQTTGDDDGMSFDVLTAGAPIENPGVLLSGEALSDLFLELETSAYDRVVVECPALLGSIQGQLVARHADALLVACDVDRLSPANALELGDLLRALDLPVTGLVAFGSPGGGYTYRPAAAPPRSERVAAGA